MIRALMLRFGGAVQAFLVRVREGYGPARPEDFTGEDRYGDCIAEAALRRMVEEAEALGLYDDDNAYVLDPPDDLHLTFPAWERPTPLVEDDPWAEWLDLGESGA